jgi:hypothetical protein
MSVDNPEIKLKVEGAVRIKSTVLGEGLFFEESEFSLGAINDGFRLQKSGWRIFEVYGKTGFSFDNVNVYPDNDNQQQLGLENNRWSKLYVADINCSGDLSLSNLETPPPGADVVELVMDKATGKIYRKS